MPTDLHKKIRQSPARRLIVFAVDASDSMQAKSRMAAAKGAVLALLTHAYKNRDRVGLVAFGGEEAEVILHPTGSVALAKKQLQQLKTGGMTPFADGLQKAWRLIKNERRKQPEIRALLVVISDGDANVMVSEKETFLDEICEIAARIREDQVQSIAIDTCADSKIIKEMRRIAQALGAPYYPIENLRAGNVMEAIKNKG